MTGWLDTEGSTRSLGLLRVALALLLWCTWGLDFVFYLDPDPRRVALAVAFYGLATLLLAGLWSQATAAATAVVLGLSIALLGSGPDGALWLEPQRQLTALLTLVLACSPCGRSLSLDRYLALRRARRDGTPAPDERGPLWALAVLQLGSTLFFAATAIGLADGTWLSGATFAVKGSTPAWGPAVAWLLLAACAWLAVGPWIPRLRTAALLSGGTALLLLHPLMLADLTPLCALCMLSAFVPPEAAHRAIDRMHGAGQ